MKSRKRTLAAFGFVLPALILSWLPVAAVQPAAAVERGVLPMARDLSKVAREARERRVPILILFSSAGCHFCAQVREGFLIPTTRNAEYDDKVLMVEIDAGSPMRLLDFEGRPTTHAEFAARHHVGMTPTVKFLDPQGREAAAPLVGIANPDFYGGPLDEAIHTALARVRGAGHTAAN